MQVARRNGENGGLTPIIHAEFVIVLTTFPVDRDADAFARTLVNERLAACVNVLAPMQSIYRWKGAIETAAERQILIKTRAASVTALAARFKVLHPYEVPEFLVITVESGSDTYLAWLRDNVTSPGTPRERPD